jgi:hypothetical protein
VHALLDACLFVWVGAVVLDAGMEVAIADVTKDGGEQVELSQFLFRKI